MHGLILTDDVIASEHDVVLEGRRQRIDGNPQALLGKKSIAALY